MRRTKIKGDGKKKENITGIGDTSPKILDVFAGTAFRNILCTKTFYRCRKELTLDRRSDIHCMDHFPQNPKHQNAEGEL